MYLEYLSDLFKSLRMMMDKAKDDIPGAIFHEIPGAILHRGSQLTW